MYKGLLDTNCFYTDFGKKQNLTPTEKNIYTFIPLHLFFDCSSPKEFHPVYWLSKNSVDRMVHSHTITDCWTHKPQGSNWGWMGTCKGNLSQLLNVRHPKISISSLGPYIVFSFPKRKEQPTHSATPGTPHAFVLDHSGAGVSNVTALCLNWKSKGWQLVSPTGLAARSRGTRSFPFPSQPQMGCPLPTNSVPVPAPGQLPAYHFPPLRTVHPCPCVLPLRYQRWPDSWKMVPSAKILFLSFLQFTWIAKKWRLSMMPKIWKEIRLRGLLPTFNFTRVIFHFSSVVLILTYQVKKKKKKTRIRPAFNLSNAQTL